jgi:putative FmdB family regulatory protein
MPFYEYECANCKFYTEALQKITDAPLRKCPSCGKSSLKKLISAPVFRLKGSGWYETDFKGDNENKRNLVGDEKPPADKADAKTDTKGETKPEAKADAPATPAATPKDEPKSGVSDARRAGAKASRSSAKPARKATPPPRKAAPKRPVAAKTRKKAGRR